MAVHLGVDDAGHQVVAGIAAAELRQLDPGVGEQRYLRDRVLRLFLWRAVLLVAHAEEFLRGVRHGGLVCRRHTEHVHDRQHRQPRRTRGDEVDVAGPDEIVDDADRVAVDLFLDLTDVSRRECRADQASVGGVLRRIHAQEEGGEPLDLRRHRIQCHPLRRGEQLGVLADVGDVGASRQCPEPGLLHRKHRRQWPVPAEPLTGAKPRERFVADREGPAPEVV